MADDDEFDDETGAFLREQAAVISAQQDLILTLIQALAMPIKDDGDESKAERLKTKLESLPGVIAYKLATKYKTTRLLADEDEEDGVHTDALDALENLLVRLDPDNLGDWQ